MEDHLPSLEDIARSDSGTRYEDVLDLGDDESMDRLRTSGPDELIKHIENAMRWKRAERFADLPAHMRRHFKQMWWYLTPP